MSVYALCMDGKTSINPGAHLLVVDDDQDIRELLQDYLQRNGYQVTVVADGQGMWQALAGC